MGFRPGNASGSPLWGTPLVAIYGAFFLIRRRPTAQHFMGGCRLWDGLQVAGYGCLHRRTDLVLLGPRDMESHKQDQGDGKVTFYGKFAR